MYSIKNDVSPLLKLVAPLAMTGLVNASVWFFETLFLARLGTETLAAGSLVSWLFGTVSVILYGALSSVNILVAHKHGANDEESIALIARDGLILAITLAFFAFILFWNMPHIFLFFGQPESVVALATSYLHSLSWGLLADFLVMACLEVIMGVGHARVIFVFSIIAVVSNIVSSYTLIFGKFGFQALGIAGAGWGMTVSYSVTLIILTVFILANEKYRKYFRYIFKLTKPNFLVELIQIGIPMGVMYCVEVAFFFALTLVMGILGTEVQAANQVALQYLGLMMSTMFSVAKAITVRMGYLLGAKEIYAAEKASYIGIAIAAIFITIVGMFYWLYPMTLISIDFDIYNPENAAIIAEIKKFLSICAVFQIIEATRIAFFGALRGLKDTKFTMLTSIISFWGIALPIGYVLTIQLQIGATGFWWGMIMGASVSVMLLQWRFRKKIKYYAVA